MGFYEFPNLGIFVFNEDSYELNLSVLEFLVHSFDGRSLLPALGSPGSDKLQNRDFTFQLGGL